jgi:addiction module RelB/DinJ family antitoxin
MYYKQEVIMAQSNLIQVRIDSQLKQEAESLFADLGLDTPAAIRMFLKTAVAQNGIPFSISRLKTNNPLKQWKGLTESMQKPLHVGEDFKIYSKEDLNAR